MTEIAEAIDWGALTPRTRAIVRTIGPLISSGFTLKEIARHFGKSDDWVSTRVAELRQALAEQALLAGLEMPAELEASLRAITGRTASPADGETSQPSSRTGPRAGTSRDPA